MVKSKMTVPFQSDPTHTHTLRNSYERKLAKLVKRYGKAVLASFKEGLLPSGRRWYNDVPRHLGDLEDEYPLEEFAIIAQTQKEAILIGDGRNVIDEYMPSIFSKGQGSVNHPSSAHQSMITSGSMGAADWRALDAAKVANLQALRFMSDGMNAEIVREVTKGIRDGTGADAVADRIKHHVGIGEGRARLIARTETIAAYNRGAAIKMEQYGYDAYIWIADIGERTCPWCGGLHGKLFNLHDKGNQMPPLHPNCRCSVEASLFNRAELGLENVTVDDVVAKTDVMQKKLKEIKQMKKDMIATEKWKADVLKHQTTINADKMMTATALNEHLYSSNLKDVRQGTLVNKELGFLYGKEHYHSQNEFNTDNNYRNRPDLTSKQMETARLYQGSSYKEWNKYCKQGFVGSGQDLITEGHIKVMDGIIAKSVLPKRRVMYRGVRPHVAQALEDSGKMAENKFVSVSLDPSVAQSSYFTFTEGTKTEPRNLIVMEGQAGMNGLYMDNGEKEYVLPRSTQFKLIEKVHLENARIVGGMGGYDKDINLYFVEMTQ